jgi:hypothetical protein
VHPLNEQLTLHAGAIQAASQMFLVWFAFVCTINGTMIVFLHNDSRRPLRTTIVHMTLAIGDFFGAIIAWQFSNYFSNRSQYIGNLTKQLPNPPDFRFESPVADSVLWFQALGVGLICIFMALGWLYAWKMGPNVTTKEQSAIPIAPRPAN